MGTIVTCLQIFGIGFSFGLAGPCFLTCTPILVTYIAGSKRSTAEVFKDIFTFLSGRLLAYVLLGALAGFSGAVLKKFTDLSLSSYLEPLAGMVTILFAIIILTNTLPKNCHCEAAKRPNIRLWFSDRYKSVRPADSAFI
jgi:sulfite exporter TauE/SafE